MKPELIWIIAGIVLIITEFVVPSFLLIFFGTSALLVGVLNVFGVPMPFWVSVTTFAVASILQIVFMRRTFKEWFKGKIVDEGPEQDEFIGREATVVSGFDSTNSFGSVEFRGTPWNAESDSILNEGDRVQITGRSGINLIVKKIS